MCESNEGITANRIHRALGVSYKAASRMYEVIDTAIFNAEPDELSLALRHGEYELAHIRSEGKTVLSDYVQNDQLLNLLKAGT